MKSDHKIRDVSCLVLAFYFEYLKSRGVPPSELVAGLHYSEKHLFDRLNWIDYESYKKVEQRFVELFPDEPEPFYKLGRSITKTKIGFGFVKTVTGSMLPPIHFYARQHQVTARFLFRYLDVSTEVVSKHRALLTYRFQQGYQPTAAFVETTRGILSVLPRLVGHRSAKVEWRKISALEYSFEVDILSQRKSLLAVSQSIVLRTRRYLGRRLVNMDASKELEESNRLLIDNVEELTRAKVSLDQKVHHLSIMNELNRAATSERDPRKLAQRACQLISQQLDNRRVAIFLFDAVCDSWALTANSQLVEQDRELLQQRLERKGGRSSDVALPYWRTAPMRCGAKLLGELLVGVEVDPELHHSMASELAVALDNALAYTLIKDLRDNLELRVEQRTNDLEQARCKLETTVKDLERANRVKQEFLATVSHEFKTPLTLIMAPLETVENAAHANGEVLEAVGHIRRNASSLLQMVTEMLDFASLDGSEIQINHVDFDLGRLVMDAFSTLEPLAARKSLRLEQKKRAGSCFIHGDPRLLNQAVCNLITNAIKYSEDGDAIVVDYFQDQQGVKISVADNGPGIAEDQQQQVFERFRRASDLKGRLIEGSGLGLALVKQIAELHRGGVELKSEMDRGSEFIIRLPSSCIRKDLPDSGERQWVESPNVHLLNSLADDFLDSAGQGRGAEPPPEASTVLLIEDNAEMRRFLSNLLGRYYHLLTAKDGEEGLHLARNHVPNLVLSDIMMPRVDGFAVCQQLKQDAKTQNIPVVLVSAMHGSEVSARGFAAGADDFVVKPFSNQELLARIHAQLRIRALAKALLRLERQSSIGLMAAGFAHEVLNPLNSVVNAVPPIRKILERMQQGDQAGQKETCDQLLDAVEQSGERIHNIVTSMLTFGSHGDDYLTMKPTRLCDSLDAVIDVLRHRAVGVATIHRKYDWRGEILCHPELVNQTVANLVNNAIDALQENHGGNIWIATKGEGDVLRMSIRDDGPGIRREIAEDIFKPFFTTKAPGSGTGLGLAIGREVVALHGGTLELTPNLDQGTEFVIEIPLGEKADQGDDAFATPQRLPPRAGAARR